MASVLPFLLQHPEAKTKVMFTNKNGVRAYTFEEWDRRNHYQWYTVSNHDGLSYDDTRPPCPCHEKLQCRCCRARRVKDKYYACQICVFAWDLSCVCKFMQRYVKLFSSTRHAARKSASFSGHAILPERSAHSVLTSLDSLYRFQAVVAGNDAMRSLEVLYIEDICTSGMIWHRLYGEVEGLRRSYECDGCSDEDDFSDIEAGNNRLRPHSEHCVRHRPTQRVGLKWLHVSQCALCRADIQSQIRVDVIREKLVDQLTEAPCEVVWDYCLGHRVRNTGVRL